MPAEEQEWLEFAIEMVARIRWAKFSKKEKQGYTIGDTVRDVVEEIHDLTAHKYADFIDEIVQAVESSSSPRPRRKKS